MVVPVVVVVVIVIVVVVVVVIVVVLSWFHCGDRCSLSSQVWVDVLFCWLKGFR